MPLDRAFYTARAATAANSPEQRERGSPHTISKGVAKQVLQWRDQYGKVLRDVSFEKMTSLVDSWDAWRRDIDGTQCDSIETLMFVLNTIQKVVDASVTQR